MMMATDAQEKLAQRTLLGLLILVFAGALWGAAVPQFVYEIHEDLGGLVFLVFGVLPSLILYWIGGVLLTVPTIPLFFKAVWDEDGKSNWLYWPFCAAGWVITLVVPFLAYNMVDKLVAL